MKLKWYGTLFTMALACSDKANQAGPASDDTQTVSDTAADTHRPISPVDADGDGFPADQDCNDEDARIYPGADEICDDIDNDCDGQIDEIGAIGGSVWYADHDGDGFGDPDVSIEACDPPSGYTSDHTDCNDDDETAYPGAEEICDGVDNNCNASIDEGLEQTWYADSDGDGYGDPDTAISDCDPGSGYVDNDDDCDDSNASTQPGRSDYCNGIDDDCDGLIDEDSKSGWDLVTIDTNSGYVYEVDTTNGSLSSVSAIADTSLKINTMDVSENGTAIVQDHLGNQMLYMDACTGKTVAIGSTGVGNMCGIAFGPSGLLYGLDSTNDQLIEIDVFTGAGTVIGDLGFDLGNCGLSYDCTNDRLVGANANTNEIFTVDPVTGLGSGHIGTDVPFASVGLEFDPTRQVLYASTGSQLYEVEPTSGATTYLGAHSSALSDDLALHPTCP